MAAATILLMGAGCDDEPRDAYYGTDAGSDFRLEPLPDAMSDASADRSSGETGDGLARDVVGEAGNPDAGAGGASDALEAGRDVPPTLDASVDVADTAMTAADVPAGQDSMDAIADVSNDASPG
jgi:hypothetical protein